VAYRVRTLVPGVSLPGGHYIPVANTTVVLSDVDYAEIDARAYSQGLLTDLGADSGSGASTASVVATALALNLAFGA
jgi:hypothetical protein